ncbi:PKD-like domain-containing protein [Flavobacterium aquidurense]|uniref:PKD-like domain-containing protein n=1 Tax=Flavobacterium aquidurense TaxID=362413 RepID=UPI002862D43F|nr:PKD-like domain-containing protein [Flavobacterium aquidurense]MDR7373035.1 hypothetical protein [Flavobacterium aquidurense]
MKKLYFSLNQHTLVSSRSLRLLFMVLMGFLSVNFVNAQGTNCAGSTSISIGNCITGNINISDNTQNAPNICSGTFRREGWYTFTVAGGPLNITITASASNKNLYLQLISATSSCNGFTQIACANVDNNNDSSQTESINANALANGIYYVKVVNVGNSTTNNMNLTSLCVTAVPTITSFSPTSSCVGSTITINGTNFRSVTAANVKIGSTAVASITSFTSTQIIAVVGSGTTGAVSVTTPDGTASGAGNFTVNALPTIFNVTGTGSYCIGGPGLEVGLSGSETLVNYQLYNGANPVGSPVAGTGAALSFGFQPGTNTYTVKATNANNCTATMASSAVVTVNNLPIASAGGSQNICLGASATVSGASSSNGTIAWTHNGAGSITGATTLTPVYTPVAADAGTTVTLTMTVSNSSCIPIATANYSVIVLRDNTVTAASSSPTLCINTPLISAITHTTTEATGIGTPVNLPAGVTATWASNTITISGTPTVVGTFNYSIPLTGCGGINAIGTIIVTPNIATGPASTTPTLCINTPLTAITHATTGVTGIGAPVNLPAGITATWASNTITISGTPSETGTFNYSIPLIGGCGAVLNATGSINVLANNTVSGPSSTPTLCSHSPLTAITHTTTIATGIANAGMSGANGLPIGVSATWASNTITISGTPTVGGTFNYSIPLTGGCGSTIFATGTILVSPLPANAGLISGTASLCQGQTNVSYSVPAIADATSYIWTVPTGATIVSGLGTQSITVDYSIGALSGNVTVKGNNACGDGVVSTLPITVNITPSITTNYAPVACSSFAVNVTPLDGGGNFIPSGTTYSWSLPTTSGGITGATALSGQAFFSQTLTNTTNIQQTASYNITATTGGCAASTFSIVVTVNPKPNAVVSVASQTICGNDPITPITISFPTTVPGTTYTWTRDNANVTGIIGVGVPGTGNTISGNLVNTTNIDQLVTFTVSATAAGCTGTTTSTVTVKPTPTIAITNAAQTICSGTAIAGMSITNPNAVAGTTYTWTRDNTTFLTGIAASGNSNAPFSISGTLTNTQTTTQTTTFTITATGPNACKSTSTATVTVYGRLVAPVIGNTQDVCIGQAPTIFSIKTPVAGGSGTYTYQWQVRTRQWFIVWGAWGGWSNVGTGTTYQAGVPNATTQYEYRLIVTDSYCTAQNVTSNVISISTTGIGAIYDEATITGGTTTPVCNGDVIPPILASIDHSDASYVNYYMTTNNSYLTPASAGPVGTTIEGTFPNGANRRTSHTFNFTANNTTNSTQTTVISIAPEFDNFVGTCRATPATMSIQIKPTPKVTATVASVGICNVTSAGIVLSGNITDPGNITTFNWSVDDNPNITGDNTSGSGSIGVNGTYTINNELTNTSSTTQSVLYTITPTSNGCTGAAITVNISVNPTVTAGTIGDAQTICNGTIPSPLTSAASGTGLGTITYEWQTNASGSFVTIGSETGATYSPPALTTTTSYQRRTVSVNGGGTCYSAYTTPITITVIPVINPGAISGNRTICKGGDPDPFTETTPATGVGLTYQWQTSSTGGVGSWTNIVGAESTTYDVSGPITQNTYYRREVKSTENGVSCYAYSGLVAVFVNDATAPVMAGNQSVCGSADPDAFTVSTAATGLGSLTYQWESNTTGCSGSWTPIFGATNDIYNPGPVTQTTYYRVVVTSTSNTVQCTAISNCLVVTYNPNLPVSLDVVASANPICSGASVTFTATPTNGGPAPVYQWKLNGANVGTNLPTYTSATLVNGDSVTCVMTSNATCATGNPVTSTPIVMTINTTPVAPVLNNIVLACSQTTAIETWGAIPNTTEYRFDLSLNPSFSSFVTGYQNLQVSALASPSVTLNSLASNTTYYVRVRTVTSCGVSPSSNVVTLSVPVTTFTGSGWDNGTPNATTRAVFATNTNITTPLNACSCQVNSGVNVVVGTLGGANADAVLKVENELDVLGTLTFENNASLIQVNDASLNTGIITYKRITTPMKNYDYTFWCSPVEDQVMNVLSPNTLIDKYFSWANSAWVYENGSSSMNPVGKGFMIRVPKPDVTYANGESWSGLTYAQPVQFVGKPYNGVKTILTQSDGKHNLIGNPYPSPIDADAFIKANQTIINGALKFWTHNTSITASGNFYVYNSDDYAYYTLLGGTTAISGGVEPEGKIAAGQSFFVVASAGQNFVFNNTMRNTDKILASGSNSQFFRMSNANKAAAIEKDRVWLNLANSQGAFKQLLVGYIGGATNEMDKLYDALSSGGNTYIDFYSINGENKFTIQGRAVPFQETDKISLGYKTTIKGTFTININKVDGLLISQNIYLEDKTTSTIVDLKKEPYTFSTEIGTFNDRFILRFTTNNVVTNTLGTATVDETKNPAIVAVKNKQIKISSFEEIIDKVKIYDLKTSLLYEKVNVNNNELIISDLHSSDQFLIMKILLKNGKWITKKILF